MLKYIKTKSGFLAALCALTLAILSGFVQQFMLSAEAEQRYTRYGEWHAAMYGTGSEAYSTLAGHAAVDEIGRMTAVGLLVDKGGSTVGVLGYVDDSAVELGHIRLSAGRMPSNAREIALEQSTLVALGYSFDLGQTVTLNAVTYSSSDPDREHALEATYTFTLVGLLESYSVVWASAQDGPVNAIVGNDFSSAGLLESEILLIYGDYANVSEAAELSSLTPRGAEFVMNYRAYPSASWTDNAAWLLSVSLALVTLLCGVFSFLHAEAERVSIYRDLGADFKNVRAVMLRALRKMLSRGSAWATSLSLLCFVAFTLIHRALTGLAVPVTLSLVGHGALRAALAWLLCLVFAYVFCCLQLARIYRADSRGAALSERRDRRPRALTLNALMRIHRRADRKLYVTKLLLAAIYCATSFTLVYLVEARRVELRRWQSVMIPSDYVLSTYTLTDGFDEDGIYALNRTEGVGSVRCYSLYDSTSANGELLLSQELTWLGSAESAYAAENLASHSPLLGLSEDLVTYFAALADGDALSGLNSGGAVLYLPGYTYDSLQIGDSITLTTEYGDFTAPVAGIITQVPSAYDSETHYAANILASVGIVLVSKDTLDNFVGFETRYNRIDIYTDGSAESFVTDKLISRAAASTGGMSFQNNLEETELLRSEYNSFRLLSHFGFAAISIIYAFAVYYSNSAVGGRESKYMSVLRALGLTRRDAKRLMLRGDALRSIAFALCGALGGFALWSAKLISDEYLAYGFSLRDALLGSASVASLGTTTYQFMSVPAPLCAILLTSILPIVALTLQLRESKLAL